jgi:hypothetical protein
VITISRSQPFRDNGKREFAFQRKIAGRCPRCQRRAYVVSDNNRWRATSARLSCSSSYNAAHLSFIRDYAQATIRIRAPDQNRSLASRLPRFLKDHRNRAAVLKAISALETPKDS